MSQAKKSTRKKVKAAGAAKEKAPKAPRPRPTGPAPSATVLSRHNDGMHERPARGFSLGEIDAASIPAASAKGLKLLVDSRRRSTLEGNVDALREWYQGPTREKPKRKSE